MTDEVSIPVANIDIPATNETKDRIVLDGTPTQTPTPNENIANWEKELEGLTYDDSGKFDFMESVPSHVINEVTATPENDTTSPFTKVGSILKKVQYDNPNRR